jgi:hypothetical protein
MGKKARVRGTTLDVTEFIITQMEDNSWAEESKNPISVEIVEKPKKIKKERYITSFPDFRNTEEKQTDLISTDDQKEDDKAIGRDVFGNKSSQAQTKTTVQLFDRESFGQNTEEKPKKELYVAKKRDPTLSRNIFGITTTQSKPSLEVSRDMFGITTTQSKPSLEVSRDMFGLK